MGLLVVHVAVTSLPGLAALEGFSIDARFRLRGPRAAATDAIVIVGLDNATRERHPEVFQSRAGWAQLIDALTAARAKVIALDVLFSAPEELLPAPLTSRVIAEAARKQAEPESTTTKVLVDVALALQGDQQVAEAVARSRRVILGANFRVGPAVVAATEPDGLARARYGEVADGGGGGARRPMTANSVAFAVPAIARGATSAGAINTIRDADGVTRRLPLVIELAGRHYMPLGIAAVLAAHPANVSYVIGDERLMIGDRDVAVTAGGSMMLDVLGRDGIPRVSAADVLDGTAGDRLAGKLVFVGLTYAEADKAATPLDALADGVELHATLAENLLGDRLLAQRGPLSTLLATLVLCAIVVVTQLRRIRRRAWVPPLAAALGMAAYVAIGLALFARGSIIELAAPILITGFVLFAATIAALASEGRDKAQLRAVFSQYVSARVVDRLLEDPPRLGGVRKELTVLFSDIRGFSHVAEGLQPETLAAFLGEYLTPMTELVLRSGGTLDKYIGDAVMAFWGAPVDDAEHARKACEVALRMQEVLRELNARWTAAGKPALAIGIGVNTGPMAVGNMGSVARFDYTVLGDEVNLASRLEALTKDYGVQILVGEATAKAAGDGFVFREIDLVRVKGRALAEPVFELVGRRGHALATGFADALAHYRRREFTAARDAFAAIAGDPAAARMAERCEVLAASPPPADWDGVYDQLSK